MEDKEHKQHKQRLKNKKKVFVTVGTTEFDQLIETVVNREVFEVLEKQGYNHITLQTGRGCFTPPLGMIGHIEVDHFQYKPSIQEEISSADLVISHAGAGSCLETLGAGKPLLVVINNELMDNHQLELAKQLCKDGHIYYCDCGSLPKTLKDMNIDELKPFEPGDPSKFAAYLDNKLGFS